MIGESVDCSLFFLESQNKKQNKKNKIMRNAISNWKYILI